VSKTALVDNFSPFLANVELSIMFLMLVTLLMMLINLICRKMPLEGKSIFPIPMTAMTVIVRMKVWIGVKKGTFVIIHVGTKERGRVLST